MVRAFALVVIIISGLFAVAQPAAAFCSSPTLEQAESNAQAVGGSTLTSAIWQVNVIDTSYPTRITVNWFSGKFEAIAHLDYVDFGCNVTSWDTKDLLTKRSFQAVFGGWASYREINQCKLGSTTLTEFDAVETNGSDYHALYWVKQKLSGELISLNLVFPVHDRAKQAIYARRLFPELSACPPAGQ